MNLFPDLSGEKIISVDTETKDPKLVTHGPGVYRKDGHLAGFSLATASGFCHYYDVAHPGPKEAPPEQVLAYLGDVLKLPIPKVGANLLYDFDWLVNGHGFKVNGAWWDIQSAEALLNENKTSYKLDTLAWEYLRKRKEEAGIYQWASAHGIKSKEVKGSLWKMPAEVVRPYGEADAALPIEIFRHQYPKLKALGFLDATKYSEMPLWDIECELLKVLIKMRRTGVRINAAALHQLENDLDETIGSLEASLRKMAGDTNYNSPLQVKEYLKSQGVGIPVVSKKNAAGEFENRESVAKDVLSGIDHPFAKAIIDIKAVSKLRSFCASLRDHIVDGRIHCQFSPLRDADYGTRTGRFSSFNPNLQQIPIRNETWGPRMRSIFIPEEGMAWGSLDYSQIEPRLLAHDAIGISGERLRAEYAKNPKLSYHKVTAEMAHIPTSSAKTINLGLSYGMGLDKLRRSMAALGHSEAETDVFLEQYHAKLPYVRETTKAMARHAERTGYIKTLLGRYRRFENRRNAYRAANARFQGGSADIIKKAMVDADREGLWEILPPHIQVHDELNQSIPKTREGWQAFCRLKEIMETTVALRVPLIASPDVGTSWGALSEPETLDAPEDWV